MLFTVELRKIFNVVLEDLLQLFCEEEYDYGC